ncbi:hypothetical protein LTR85_007427 [Meristemomyces frigidus]|nr:hypothetical protein LTR85_007427 [Meristemomyces frigidus]
MDVLSSSSWKTPANAATAGTVSLGGLPPEMLHRIFAYMKPKDVVSARLVCSLLATIGAEHLTEEIRLMYASDSFEDAKNLSAHPVGKRVTRLFFLGDRVNEYPTLESWANGSEIARSLTSLESNTSPGLSPSAWDAHLGAGRRYARFSASGHEATLRSYTTTVNLFRDQQQLADSGADVEYLVDLFRHCPRLDSIELSIGSAHKRLGGKLAPQKPASDIEPYKAGAYHMQTICAATKTAGRTLKCLSAYDVGYRFLEQEPSQAALMKEALKTLHSFRLRIAAAFDEDSYDENDVFEDNSDHASLLLSQGALRDILTSMPHLRILRLKLPSANADDELSPIGTLNDVVGSVIWPKLRDFGISTICTTENDLVDFLFRHSARLRRLSLSSIMLTHGNWRTLFSHIAGRFPRLQKVKLSGDLSHHDGGRERAAFRFPIAGKKGSPVRQAMERYVREGGAYPDPSTLGRGPATVVHRKEDDGEYDSGGSHISYGSDEFDLLV